MDKRDNLVARWEVQTYNSYHDYWFTVLTWQTPQGAIKHANDAYNQGAREGLSPEENKWRVICYTPFLAASFPHTTD